VGAQDRRKNPHMTEHVANLIKVLDENDERTPAEKTQFNQERNNWPEYYRDSVWEPEIFPWREPAKSLSAARRKKNSAWKDCVL
jgi:hypothetical protein